MNQEQIDVSVFLQTFQSKEKKKAMNSLKKLDTIGRIQYVVSKLHMFYPWLKEEQTGMLLPKNIVELCSTRPVFFRPNSYEEELNWILSTIADNWSDLKWFSKMKKVYEHNFFLANYLECSKILEAVKQRLGVSLWYYTNEFLLYEYQGKKGECMQFFSSIVKESEESGNKNYLIVVLQLLYLRSLRNISPTGFDEELTSLYKKNKTDLHEDYYKYLLFRLNFHDNWENVDLDIPILFENISSIVDRYLMIILTIKTAWARTPNEIICQKAQYIYRKTQECELLSILAATDKKIPITYYNSQFIAILDAFYKGDYVSSEKLCLDFFDVDASSFDVYAIYCYSLAYQQKLVQSITVKQNSVANIICRNMYNVIINEKREESLYHLRQIEKNISDFYLAHALACFIKRESNESTKLDLKYLQNIYYDPALTKTQHEKNAQYSYLKKGEVYWPDSVSLSVWSHYVDAKEITSSDVALRVKELHNANCYLELGEYDKAFISWKYIYNKNINFVPQRQIAISKMVECHCHKGDYEEAINLYVDSYIYDYASTLKVNTTSIIKQMQKDMYVGYARTLQFFVFVALNAETDVDKSMMLYDICMLYGKQFPSELIDVFTSNEYNERLVELFFSKASEDAILHHYFLLKTLKDKYIESERVLKYLLKIDSKSHNEYAERLKRIENALLVYKIAQNINDSKIYANDEAIIRYKLNESDCLFKRYCDVYETICKTQYVYFVNLAESTMFAMDKYGQEPTTETVISSNGLYPLFYTIYNKIKEQFLWSDFGLVAYLSTRVRHGELETQLRPELSKKNVILLQNGNMYIPTDYWKREFALSEETSIIINKHLRAFSEAFDRAIQYLIKEILQIHSVDKQNGLFIYEPSATEIANKAIEYAETVKKNAGTVDFFNHLVLDWLWEMTEKNLVEVRSYVANNLTNNINRMFDELSEHLYIDIEDGHCKTQLLSQVKASREFISVQLKKIERWFTISKKKLENIDVFSLSRQVYQLTKDAFPQIITHDELHIEGNPFIIKAEFVPHYADILKTTLFNVFGHSSDKDGIRHFDLNIKVVDNRLIMTFVNDIPEDSIDDLRKDISRRMSQKVDGVGGEGGSGIMKVRKIIQKDLEDISNSMNLFVSDDAKYHTNISINIKPICANV